MTKKDALACVGCGYCCLKTPCDASRRLYPGAAICPQLFWSKTKNRYECGLMKISGLVGEGYRKELAAGEGCCCSLNSWRKDVKPRNRIEANSFPASLDSEFQIFLKCLSGEFMSSDKMMMTLYKMEGELEDKKNYSKEEARATINKIIHFFNNNRPSYMEDFMG